MGEAGEAGAARFLLETLKDVLVYHADLIMNVDDRVKDLDNDLNEFRAILQDSSPNLKLNASSYVRLREIRDIIYDIEDEIDKFRTLTAQKKKNKPKFGGFTFFKSQAGLLDVAKKVEKLKEKVKATREKGLKGVVPAPPEGHNNSQANNHPRTKAYMLRRDNVMGFQKDADEIIKYLKEDTKELDVITIIGLPGQGKTTLASKVFHDPEVESKFTSREEPEFKSIRIWVDASHKHRPKDEKDVLLDILESIPEINKGTRDMTEQKMADILRAHLKKLDSFFVVIDDVWGADHWKVLKEAFPKEHKAGKILITTQDEEVAHRSNTNRGPHRLQLLTAEESWELLKFEVFQNSKCPDEIEMSGKLIARKCEGLPLLIVVVGEILVRKCLQGNILQKKQKWEEMSKSLSTHISEDGCQNILTVSLSYNKLPYYLRPCFLYLGIFPEEYAIPVGTLIKLWIAEGYIIRKHGEILEETARGYLDELITRNLVMIHKRTPDGQIKKCRVHYMIREFCKREATIERQNIFQEVKYSTEGAFEPHLSDLAQHRRLCMDSNIKEFLSFRPRLSWPNVRSFLYFPNDRGVPSEVDSIAFVPTIFEVLRVLDVKPISIKELSSDWKKLIHLRYVVLSSDLKIIPKVIAKLWNMQTLIVNVPHTSSTLEIKANVWKMDQLRHVKTNVSTILPSKHRNTDGNNLQTLGTISHLSCTQDVFDRLRNLRKLGIHGQLDKLLEGKVLAKLRRLEKLKLVQDESESGLSRLPNAYEFPPNLRRLTLSNTRLEWSCMSILESLDKLEVLKLKKNAFMGDTWSTKSTGFSYLTVLHIEDNKMIFWTATANPFPILRCLVLRRCTRLEAIPETLGENLNLEKMELDDVKTSAGESAKKIKQQLQEGQESCSGTGQFELYINSAIVP